jgi:hypothetical protein
LNGNAKGEIIATLRFEEDLDFDRGCAAEQNSVGDGRWSFN